jgi:tetratricopeptide (TPR) repeat protein
MNPIAMPWRLTMAAASAFMISMLCAAPARAATVTLSPGEGERVSDIVTVTARVTGFEEAGVRNVVFLIDGRERGSDSSIPYTLEWDTLSDTDGAHKLAAVATDMNGNAARAEVNVVVDNELARGAQYHAQIALEAVRAGDRERAERHARRAIKIDPTNLAAARALSAIYRVSKEYDKAIAVLEQAGMPEDAIEPRLDLAALYVLRGDAGETIETLLMGANTALEQCRKADQARIASLKRDATPEQKGDAAFAARDWAGAVRAYQGAGDPVTATMGAMNRLLLAYARAGRRRDCDVLLRTLEREKRADDVTRSVQAYYLLTINKPREARSLVQSGAESRVYPALIVAASADLILGEKKRAESEIAALAEIRPHAPEVLFLQAHIAKEPLEVRRLLTEAMAAEPSWPEVYVRKAYDLLMSKRPNRIQEAEAVLEFARKVDMDNVEALMATAALFLFQHRAEEAEPILKRVLTLAPEAPDALVGMALTCSMLDRTREITDLLARAMKVDDILWNDVFVPKQLDYISRVMRYRIPALLTPKSLYPTEPN